MGWKFDGNMHEEFTDSNWNSIHFLGSKIYSVQTCCFYYTSDDLQRECDTVNPCMHPDIMLWSPITEENAKPYWYARVLRVYHTNVWAENSAICGSRNARCIDSLWVCWSGEEPGYCSGFHQAHLPKISFVQSMDDITFSFVDPANCYDFSICPPPVILLSLPTCFIIIPWTCCFTSSFLLSSTLVLSYVLLLVLSLVSSLT